VSDNVQKDLLKKLLLRSQNRSRLWAAIAALCVGTTLLLLSVMIWWNFRELLYGKNQNDTLGSTYLVIGKKVTDQKMGDATATLFTPQDVDSLARVPQVEDIGLIRSNYFPVYASMGGKLPLSTDLPLQCVPDKFIDKMPADWKWEPGNVYLPIIVSSQFLDDYNYGFAPSQGLPQLSETSVKSIAISLEIGSGDNKETVLAHVVGFSDRISSVLAPESFIEYGNKKYGKPGMTDRLSQLVIKAKDPSDVQFASYLEKHNYTTNPENLRWSRMRAIVEVVTPATGFLALLLMGIGTLVFILFIELTIARAQHSVTLLLQIGYSPRYLSRFMTGRFLPMILGTVLVSMVLAIAGQFAASIAVQPQGLTLSALPGWPVWAALLLSTAILVVLVGKSISDAIKKQV
jgi:hypothetical protein